MPPDESRNLISQEFRGNVHLLAFGLCSVLLAYNLSRGNRLNCIVYAACCVWEQHKTVNHFRRLEPETPSTPAWPNAIYRQESYAQQ